MHNKLKWILIISGIFLVIVTVVLGFTFMYIRVEVPTVTGLTLTEAIEAIKKVGLKVDCLDEFSSTVPKYIVISQEIKGGEKLNRGDVVILHVSAGVEQIIVPNLQNNTKEQAEQKLSELGFTVTVTESFNDTVEKGSVVSQSVAAGVKADKGSNIKIVVSKGPDLIEVPDITGKTLKEATDILSQTGFKIKSDIMCSSKVKEGLIISQDVEPGSMLKRNSDIFVFVSAGVANSIGNSNANSRNFGNVTAQGDWVYFSNSENHHLYKMRVDGTERKLLTNDIASSINVVGEWIYYTNESDGSSLYKIRIDGSKRTKLNSDVSYNIHVVNDWVYYVRWGLDSKLYKIKTDGSQRTLLSSDACSCVNVEGNWIYYTTNDNCIYKIRTDGTNKSIVLEDELIRDLNVVDGLLYFTGKYSINKIKSDGTGLSRFNYPKRQMVYINVSDGWIYFLEHDFTRGGDNAKSALCKMRTDGTAKQEILQIQYLGLANYYINVLGDWIYFPKHDDNGSMYRVKTDGSNLEKVY